MERYYLPRDIKKMPDIRRTVALGLFDGIHNGHRAVIATALRVGKGLCTVYSFPPEEVTVKPGLHPICTPIEQFTVMEKVGVKEWIEGDFSTVRHLTPEEFVTEVLCKQLHAVRVVCGFNYRFGKNGIGTPDTLTALCREHGIDVTVVPPVTWDGQPISSTRIRQAIADGDMPAARRMMSRNFCLYLPVIHGRQAGKQWGFPTVNQAIPPDTVVPRFGVYASLVEIGGVSYPAVTNIGTRPTVDGSTVLAETYIDGFEGDLYGQMVLVYLLRFIREEISFHDTDALRRQIEQDTRSVIEPFHTPDREKPKAIFFDFDDTLHRRDGAFRPAVDDFLRHQYPGLPAEEYERRAAEMIEFNGYGHRMPCSYHAFIHHFLHKWTDECYDPDSRRAARRFMLLFASQCRPEPDAFDTLDALRKKGYLLGIITNGNSLLQNAKVDLTGLRNAVDLVVVAGDEGMQKPDPRLFVRAAARLGLPCEECVYVGDSPTNDVKGSAEAGMKPIWVDFGFPPDHPCYEIPVDPAVPVVHRLSELTALL